MAGQRIRIRLKAYDHRVIDQSAHDIVETVKRTGARVAGPIPLPTRVERFTVQRSPHADKKSQETFEQRTHKRLLDILDPDRSLIRHRVFRNNCLQVDGHMVKDLRILGRDLRRTCIVDNSPHAFTLQVDNGIPIESWFDNPDDQELLRLLPFLEELHGCADFRPLIRRKYQLYKVFQLNDVQVGQQIPSYDAVRSRA